MQVTTRRDFLVGATLTAGLAALPATQAAAGAANQPNTDMDTMTALLTRRIVRAYTGEPVSEGHITALLRAAMAAPSAVNEQAWEFVVITDKKILAAIPTVNKYASMAKSAPLAIMTCVNTKREKLAGYGVLDVAAATQNILLAAHALGLGAVWTGVYPEKDRMAAFQQLLQLPEHVFPLALVVVGHPRARLEKVDRFLPERIHSNSWQS